MSLPRIYIEACPLIDVIKHALGVSVDAARENDIWHTQACLRSALAGEMEIVTSTLTIAECRRAGDGPVPEETKRLISSILASGRVMILSQVTLAIAEKARDLEWIDGISLRGADAIHVASAIETKCQEFFTIDGRGPLKNATKIKSFGLSIIRPADTALLDPRYKQRKLVPETQFKKLFLSPP
jgi:hypothetical protein